MLRIVDSQSGSGAKSGVRGTLCLHGLAQHRTVHLCGDFCDKREGNASGKDMRVVQLSSELYSLSSEALCMQSCKQRMP